MECATWEICSHLTVPHNVVTKVSSRSNPSYNARLMLYTEGNMSDAGNEFLLPMDSRLAHYCYKPEYIDDCSKLLDEEVRTLFLDRKIDM